MAVNLDANTAVTFISEGSWVRHQLKAYAQGKQLIMAQTAFNEFQKIVAHFGGPSEQARAARLMNRVTIVPDNPSTRARGLIPRKRMRTNDIIILGTGDQLGIITMTADGNAVRIARLQGVFFQVFLHPSVPLTGT
jgi:hypothetical protein